MTSGPFRYPARRPSTTRIRRTSRKDAGHPSSRLSRSVGSRRHGPWGHATVRPLRRWMGLLRRARAENRAERSRSDKRIQPPPNTQAGTKTDPPPAPSAANRLKVLLKGRLRSPVTHCQRWSHREPSARDISLCLRNREMHALIARAQYEGRTPRATRRWARISDCATIRTPNFHSPCRSRSDRLRAVKHLTG